MGRRAWAAHRPQGLAGLSYAGFSLQSTPSLAPPVVTAPVVVNGQYVVTNPISGGQQFYRLSQ
jgi:hypothetical protein